MAYFSCDKEFFKVFSEELDIHRAAATEVLSVLLEKVTREQRSLA